jgi:hypothetical protein
VLDLVSRQAFHWDLVLAPIPKDAPSIFLSEVLNEFLKLIDDGEAVHLIQNETCSVRIQQYRHDKKNDILFLLVQLADTKVTDPSFQMIESGELRSEPKEDGEGIASSTFLAIDLQPANKKMPKYRVLCEDVPGLGRTKLSPAFTHYGRLLSASIWKDAEGKERTSRPAFLFTPSSSTPLGKELEEKLLSQIDLTQIRHKKGAFDEDGVLEEVERRIIIKVKAKVRGKDAIKLLDRVREKAKDQNYANMKVTYKGQGAQRSQGFGTVREDIGDVMTLAVTDVTVQEPRSQCEPEIRDDVVAKLREIVLEERDT